MDMDVPRIALALVLTAQTSSLAAIAEATRPTAFATKISTPLSLTFAREYTGLFPEKMGIDLEPEKLRKEALAEAKAYIKYRSDTSIAGKLQFLSKCSQKSKDDAEDLYCNLESERLAKSSLFRAPKRANEKKLREKQMALRALQAPDLAQLKHLPFAAISSAVASYETFSELKPVLAAARRASDCSIAELPSILAAKLEDFFPDSEAVNASLTFYKKAQSCSASITSAKSMYRFALISIWRGHYNDADAALAKLMDSTFGAAFQSRALYWRVMCAEQLGHKESAAALRQALMAEHPLSFHNLAANANGDNWRERWSQQAKAPQIALRSATNPESNKLTRAIEALIQLGGAGLAAELLENRLVTSLDLESENKLYLALLMNKAGIGVPKFRLLSQVLQEKPAWLGPLALKLYFPLWYLKELTERSGNIDPLLMISLVRQESGFNAHAKSSAGAQGLMQVMPSSARAVGAAAHKLYDPLFNVDAGVKIFHKSLERFSGDIELTLAAYNAGPERVAKWVQRYPLADRILFLDLIPFKETREYVASILRNYYWYVALYPAGHLDAGGLVARRPASQLKGEDAKNEATYALESSAKTLAILSAQTAPVAMKRALMQANKTETLVEDASRDDEEDEMEALSR